jgi:hypothetical protein
MLAAGHISEIGAGTASQSAGAGNKAVGDRHINDVTGAARGVEDNV